MKEVWVLTRNRYKRGPSLLGIFDDKQKALDAGLQWVSEYDARVTSSVDGKNPDKILIKMFIPYKERMIEDPDRLVVKRWALNKM